MWFRFFQINVITFVTFVLNLGVSRILDLKTMEIEMSEETIKEMNVAYWSQVYCNGLYFISLGHWIYPDSLVSVTQNAKKTSVLYDCLHYGIYVFELDISRFSGLRAVIYPEGLLHYQERWHRSGVHEMQL
jgi:hypothetical protein